MSYVVDGVELATDADGYLIEPDFGDKVVTVIAAAERIASTIARGANLSHRGDGFVGHENAPAERPLAAHSFALHVQRIRVPDIMQNHAPSADFAPARLQPSATPGDNSAPDAPARKPTLDFFNEFHFVHARRRHPMRVQRRPWPQRLLAGWPHRDPGAYVQPAASQFHRFAHG